MVNCQKTAKYLAKLIVSFSIWIRSERMLHFSFNLKNIDDFNLIALRSLWSYSDLN